MLMIVVGCAGNVSGTRPYDFTENVPRRPEDRSNNDFCHTQGGQLINCPIVQRESYAGSITATAIGGALIMPSIATTAFFAINSFSPFVSSLNNVWLGTSIGVTAFSVLLLFGGITGLSGHRSNRFINTYGTLASGILTF